MGIIVPAILPTSRHDLDEKLARLVGLSTEVQIDIVDGKFASPATWPYGEGAVEFAKESAAGGTLPYAGDLRIEMDLMIRDAEQVTGTWIAAGASRILAHIESTNYLPRLITDLKVKYGHEKGFASDSLSFGLAIDIATDSALLEPYLNDVDYVQFMGIDHDGKQGEPFNPKVLDKIKAFRSKHDDIPVQVDGGVNLETAPLLLAAGVSRLIVGSALWHSPDMKATYDRFIQMTERHGLYT
ncbi:MAG: ribulose-phosphate 3-epimerase, ribulose-phosphate 3-epimerase [Parcubacteria group bacterium]|nr:ribulose-phosphate 3-epimerase, ribulose-phosphate 3-epimerase [Parcubacteria group bacterium]